MTPPHVILTGNLNKLELHGQGVYLTDISPQEARLYEKGDLAMFLFNDHQDDRVDYWVRVDVTKLPIETYGPIWSGMEDPRDPLLTPRNKYGQPYGTPYNRRYYYVHRGQIPLKVPVVGGKTEFAN